MTTANETPANTFNYDAPPPGIELQPPMPQTFTDEVVQGVGGQQERVGLMDTNAPPPALERDLARLGGDERGRALQLRGLRPVVSALPKQAPLVYVGVKEGLYLDTPGGIDLLVPGPDNDTAVKRLHSREMVDRHPGSSRFGQPLQRDENGYLLDEREMSQGRKTPIDGSRLHVSAPASYHFEWHQTTLVHEDDLPFFMGHPVFEFVRADVGAIRDQIAQDEAERRIALRMLGIAQGAQTFDAAQAAEQRRRDEAARLAATEDRNRREGRSRGSAERPAR